jgi:hypothetical protein
MKSPRIYRGLEATTLYQNNSVKVYVFLLDEGSAAARPTQAIDLGNGLYKLLPTPDYENDDEHWEFPPGSIVRVEEEEYNGKKYLMAVKP